MALREADVGISANEMFKEKMGTLLQMFGLRPLLPTRHPTPFLSSNK